MTLVAVSGADVVGVAGASIAHFYEKNGKYGRLLILAVDDKLRGRGIGASLVAEIERSLKERGVCAIIVNSGKHRSDAHRFYRRLGFEETGIRFVKSI